MTAFPGAAAAARPPSGGPVRRGRALALAALAAAALTSAGLGLTAFQTLHAVELASVDPLAAARSWSTAFAVTAVVGAGAIALALVACVRCRPRRVAALALAVAVLLPVPVTGIAVVLGLQALRDNAVADLRAGTAAVERSVAVLGSWGVDVEPLQDLIDALPTERG